MTAIAGPCAGHQVEDQEHHVGPVRSWKTVRPEPRKSDPGRTLFCQAAPGTGCSYPGGVRKPHCGIASARTGDGHVGGNDRLAPTELIALTWQDVEFDYRQIMVSNGEIPVWPDMILQRIIRPALVRAGVLGKRIGWHTFRHSLATNLRFLGVDIKTAQELLRHANSRITLDLYTQAVSSDKVAANRKLVECFCQPAKRLGTLRGHRSHCCCVVTSSS